MKRERIKWVAVAVALAGALALLYSDWRKETPIQIFHSNRPTQTMGEDSGVSPVAFGMSEDCLLTSVRVYLLAELETNKRALPVWALTTKSNSTPTKGFLYGEPIQGMDVSPVSTREPLQPGATYRLMIEAGKSKGSHDFIPVAARKRR